MTALEQTARELLETDDPGVTWDDMIEQYSHPTNAVLINTPTLFLAAHILFASEDRGWAWYVHIAVGDIAEAWGHLPYDLEWVCWQRHSTRRLHFHPLKRIRALSHVRRIQTLH